MVTKLPLRADGVLVAVAGAVTGLGEKALRAIDNGWRRRWPWTFGWILVTCWLLRAQSPPRLPSPPSPSENLIRCVSDLPFRYFPREREWRTADGKGMIRLVHRDLTLFAQRLSLREDEGVVEAKRGVQAILAEGLEFIGGSLLYFIDERRWVMEGGKVTFKPSFFRGGGVTAPLYLTARELRGIDRRLVAQKVSFSSCDRPKAHYSLHARETEVLVGDRLILRGVGVYFGGTKLLGLRRYSVSLRPRHQRRRLPFTPDVGRSTLDGLFLRTNISLLTARTYSTDLLLDWSQKRGFGYGLEQSYRSQKIRGEASFLIKRTPRLGSEQTLWWRHEHILGTDLTLRLHWQDRRNTPFFGRRFSNAERRIELHKKWGRGTTNLTWRSFRYGTFGTSSDRTWVFTHFYRFPLSSIRLYGQFREFTRPGQATDQELTERVEIHRRLSDEWDAALRFEQRVDIDGEKFTGDNFYFALDRTPELTFSFRPRRPRFSFPSLTLSLARWREQPRKFATERLHVRLKTPYRTVRMGGSLEFRHSALFEQFLYGNDTAQYLYGYRATLRWRWGQRSHLELGYWLRKHRGFTPFRSDTLTNYENMDLRMQISPSEKFWMAVTTGLDIQRDFFRDALINIRWRPYRGMALDLSTGYSLERGRWQDILGRLLFVAPSTLGLPPTGTFLSYYGLRPSPFAEERPAPPPGGFRSELVFRYSPFRGQWTRVRLFLDWHPFRSWRLEALLGYSGIRGRMDITQFRLTRDLHCYQLWLFYNGQRGELRFFFVIKAFPILQQFFGASTQGTFLDTSLGQLY